MAPQTRSQAQSHPSAILRVPFEIQNNILLHLIPSSTESIHAILRTCKQLYDIALPLSVHTFRNLSTDIRIGEKEGGPTRNLLFLRYITITKPHLAQFVKCLIFSDFMTEGFGDDKSTRGPIGDELATYTELMVQTFSESDTSHWKSWRSDWLKDLANGLDDAQISLLLVACPNLEQLFFGEPDQPQTFKRVIYVAGKRSLQTSKQDSQKKVLLPLGRLVEFYLESQETKYGYLMWSEFAKAFSLQDLRSFEVVMANGGEGSEKEFEALPRASSNVEVIIMNKSCITAPVLHSMTGICKALRSFEYTRGVYHMYDLEMMPRDVLEAMLPHARTLEYLHLNFNDDWQKPGWEDYLKKLYMGRELKQMTGLKKLVVGMQSLTGILDCQPDYIFSTELPLEVEEAPKIVECIPDNLEHLEIHGCGKAILPQAQALLDSIAIGEYPKLKQIRLLFNSENITANDIQLQCDPAVAKLDIRLQSKQNRIYDLVPSSQLGGYITNACTRIYSSETRERWLKYRRSDIGRATVNRGIRYEPGFDASRDSDSDE
ncbi:Fc.00g093650.m01.CDS01 [Cosmosporella sp. VM-42]